VPLLVSLRVEQRLHALVVGAVGLHQVDNVELISHVLACIANAEVKPLRVVSCAIVILEDQIVLVFSHLNCSSEVA